MLTKLLKYEFRSIGRQLIPLYLGILGLAVVNHFFWFSNPSNRGGMNQTLGGVPAIATMMAYVAVCVALVVITILLIIQRFYKGLLTEEGYLMFTLPCKTWQLIASKGIAASVMTVAGTFAGILSAMLMGMSLSDWGIFFGAFGKIPWGVMFKEHALWPLYVVEGLILVLVALFAAIGHVYASISIGHLFNRHRVAWAIGAYIGINIAQSVIMVVFANLGNKFNWFGLDNLVSKLPASSGPWFAHVVLLGTIVLQMIPAAVFFFGTNWILTNKLNLE